MEMGVSRGRVELRMRPADHWRNDRQARSVLNCQNNGGFSMRTKGRLATILIALALFGCKGPLQTSAANAAEGSSGASAGDGATAPSASGGSPHKEYVTDPTLNNMNAYDVTIPAKWHFQGTLFQGGN